MMDGFKLMILAFCLIPVSGFTAEIQREQWIYEIDASQVGTIHIHMTIQEIKEILPASYTFKENLDYLQGDDDEMSLVYEIYKGTDLEIRLIPSGEDPDKLYSIQVMDAKYKIKDSNIQIGTSVKTLKSVYTVSDYYFARDVGFFLYTKEFNGAFWIDVENSEESYDLENMNEAFKIKSIIIY